MGDNKKNTMNDFQKEAYEYNEFCKKNNLKKDKMESMNKFKKIKTIQISLPEEMFNDLQLYANNNAFKMRTFLQDIIKEYYKKINPESEEPKLEVDKKSKMNYNVLKNLSELI